MTGPTHLETRRFVEQLRSKLVGYYGQDQGYHYFALYIPGIMSEHLEGKTLDQIFDKINRFINTDI